MGVKNVTNERTDGQGVSRSRMVIGSLCFALYVYKVASLCRVISKLADIHSSSCKGKYTRSIIGVIELGPKYPKIYGLSK